VGYRFALEGCVRSAFVRCLYARFGWWRDCETVLARRAAPSEGHANACGSVPMRIPPMLGRLVVRHADEPRYPTMDIVRHRRWSSLVWPRSRATLRILWKQRTGFDDIDQFCCFRVSIATASVFVGAGARVCGLWFPRRMMRRPVIKTSRARDRLIAFGARIGASYKLSRLLNCKPCVNITNKYELVEWRAVRCARGVFYN
jgi:hypothetical protein